MSHLANSLLMRPQYMVTARSLSSTISSISEEISKMASPCSLSCSIMAYTSPRAAASMPRVGSSRISTLGSVASERAITTFCWLPPDSEPSA